MSEIQEPELLPCPFCLAQPKVMRDDCKAPSRNFRVECPFCEIGTFTDSKKLVTEAWNRRVPAAPKWTTKPPKEEGYYWLVMPDALSDKRQPQPMFVRVFFDEEGNKCYRHVDGAIWWRDKKFKPMWCNAIVPPLPEGKESK